MPTKEELNEQFNITQQINAAIKTMADLVDKVNESLSTQTKLFQEVTERAKDFSTEDATKKLASTSNAMGALSAGSKKTNKDLRTFAGTLIDANKGGNVFTKMFDQIPKKALIAGTVFSGFSQGLKNVLALLKSGTSLVYGFVTGLGSMAAAIISIPFQIFNNLMQAIAGANLNNTELLQAIEDLRKSMGNLKESGARAVLDTTKTLKGFSDTGLSTWRVFGNLAERLRYVTAAAEAMGATFYVVKQEFVENGGALFGFQKGLGFTHEQMKSLTERSITVGKPMSKLFLDMTKQTLALGKAFDIDQKIIGKDMAKALQDVKHFGSLTVKEIGQAAVYAKKLGIELHDITGILDQFETFDSAAESASKLSQAFGTNIDAFALMESQNPAESLDALRKSFREAGIDSSNFTRQQAKLLAQSTGMNEGLIRQAFSAKNYGVSLDKIKKESESAEKKTLTQAEAMSKLADSIERMIKDGPQLEGSFWRTFLKGISAGIQGSREFMTLVYNVKRSLMVVFVEGVKLGRFLISAAGFPGLHQMIDGLAKLFAPNKFKKLFGGIVEVVKDFVGVLRGGGQIDFAELMESLRKKFFNFFNSEFPEGKKMLEGFKTFLRTLSVIFAAGIKWIGEQVASGLRFLIEFIKDPKGLAEGAGAAGGAGSFLAQILLPLFQATSEALTVIWPPLRELIGVLLEKVVNFLGSPSVRGFLWSGVAILATALFGPAAMQGLAGALSNFILGGIKKFIAGPGLEKAGMSLGMKGASKLLSATGVGLAIVAMVSAAEGVSKYSNKLSKEYDKSTRTIAAAQVGLVQALTFGLLPEDWYVGIGDFFASVVDTIFKAMEKFLGPGFTDMYKRMVGNQLQILGSVWDLLKALFSGDQKQTTDAFKNLGLSMINGFTSMLEWFLVQAPIFIVKWSTKLVVFVGDAITRVLVSVVSLIVAGIQKMVESVASQLGVTLNLGDWTKPFTNWGQTVKDSFDGMQKDITGGLDSISNVAAKQFKKYQDYVSSGKVEVGEKVADVNKAGASVTNAIVTNKQQAENAAAGTSKGWFSSLFGGGKDSKQVATKIEEGAKTTAISFEKASETQLESTTSRMEALRKLGKELASWNPQETLDMINDKLIELGKFTIAKPSNLEDMQKSAEAMIETVSNVANTLKTLRAMGKDFATFDPKASVELINKAIGGFTSGNVADPENAINVMYTYKPFIEAAVTMSETASKMMPGKEFRARLTDYIVMFRDLPALLGKGIAGVGGSVNTLTDAAMKLDEGLTKAMTINAPVKLKQLASGLGIGGKYSYDIKSKPINMHVNVSVYMEVGKLEKMMIMRANSVIRQRLDYFTQDLGAHPPLMPKDTAYEQAESGVPKLEKGPSVP